MGSKKVFNLNSRICLKVGSDYPRGTCENVVYHSHVTIQTILTSYLRPVWTWHWLVKLTIKFRVWLIPNILSEFNMNMKYKFSCQSQHRKRWTTKSWIWFIFDSSITTIRDNQTWSCCYELKGVASKIFNKLVQTLNPNPVTWSHFCLCEFVLFFYSWNHQPKILGKFDYFL